MELRGFKNCGHRPLYIFYEFAETNNKKCFFFPLWLTFLRDSSKFQKNIYHLLPEIERKRKMYFEFIPKVFTKGSEGRFAYIAIFYI